MFRFARVTFGVAPTSFLLNATIHHHVEGYAETHPDTVSKLLRSMYVDDVVSGSLTEEGSV